jgi:hypothetical protein
VIIPITVPYVTVASFRASPTFLDSKTLNVGSVAAADQDAELYNQLLKASSWASNTVCNMPLHAHANSENLRLRPDRNGLIKFLASDAPVRAVTAFSYGYNPGAGNLRAVTDLTSQWIEGDAQVVFSFGLGSAGFNSLQFGPAYGSELFTTWGYVAGFANTTLTNAPIAGASSLLVKDPTGIYAGDTLRIWEPGKEEAVTVGPAYVAGATTLPLTAPLINAHTIGAGISGFPPDILQAVTNYAVALLMRPDSMAEDQFPDNAPPATARARDPRKNAGGLVAEALSLLRSYVRPR